MIDKLRTKSKILNRNEEEINKNKINTRDKIKNKKISVTIEDIKTYGVNQNKKEDKENKENKRE